MQVYKFGGTSVKSADALRNVLKIIRLCPDNLVVVVSAMGKMTNAFEKLLDDYFYKNNFKNSLDKIYNFHYNIVNKLFNKNSYIFEKLKDIFILLNKKLNEPPSAIYDKEYDKIVCFGEILSATILSYYLNENEVKNVFLKAAELIKTNSEFRAAGVNFEKTEFCVKKNIDFSKSNIFVTQGFIAADNNNNPTTLGREGSDYTAAIIANIMSATELTLWKDVNGIYNADPKLIKNAVKLDKISYREATELAYFGAKIIHPKTAKPLMNNNVKLTVRSFINYKNKGTTVGNFKEKIIPLKPVFIFKENQILLTISAKEFEFINEKIFENVFSILNKFKVKINLMQNSALNLSLCFDYNPESFNKLLKEIGENFNYLYNNNLTLITIRHFSDKTIENIIENKKIKLEQKTRLNAFYLVEKSFNQF